MTQISSFVYQICHKDWRLSSGSQVSFPSLRFSCHDSTWRYPKKITIIARCLKQALQILGHSPVTWKVGLSETPDWFTLSLIHHCEKPHTKAQFFFKNSWGQTIALFRFISPREGQCSSSRDPSPARLVPRRCSMRAPIRNRRIANAFRQTGRRIWSALSGSRHDITVAGSRWKDKLFEGSATVSIISH